jgi:hypothetical protein
MRNSNHGQSKYPNDLTQMPHQEALGNTKFFTIKRRVFLIRWEQILAESDPPAFHFNSA